MKNYLQRASGLTDQLYENISIKFILENCFNYNGPHWFFKS